jgi:hypothetical protein
MPDFAVWASPQIVGVPVVVVVDQIVGVPAV